MAEDGSTLDPVLSDFRVSRKSHLAGGEAASRSRLDSRGVPHTTRPVAGTLPQEGPLPHMRYYLLSERFSQCKHNCLPHSALCV